MFAPMLVARDTYGWSSSARTICVLEDLKAGYSVAIWDWEIWIFSGMCCWTCSYGWEEISLDVGA